MRAKLNNHRMTLWSELHWVKSFRLFNNTWKQRPHNRLCATLSTGSFFTSTSHNRVDSYHFRSRIACQCSFLCILIVHCLNFFGENFSTNIQFNFVLHDQKMLVQRVWFALESLPSANILSQTLQKTSNFCSRVSMFPLAQLFITLSICLFDLIILERGSSR